MLESVKINKSQNYNPKSESLIVSIDMVLLLTDFEIFKILSRNKKVAENYLTNTSKYDYVSDSTMEPIICDRKIKNMIKWLRHPANRNNNTDEDYERIFNEFKQLYAEDIYSNVQPTQFTKGIPIMFTQSTLKELYVVLDHREYVRKFQIKALIDALGSYAYRVKLVIPEEGESIIDVIKDKLNNVTSIYYDDIEIMSEAKDKGLNLTNLCFGISDLSYNYELVEREEADPIAMLKIDADRISIDEGTGVGMIELKAFDDRDKYFALG